MQTQWWIQGRGPGGSASPIYFRLNWGPKGKKIFFGDHAPPPPPPLPPSLISRSVSNTGSAPVSLGIMLFFIFRIKSFNAFCIFLRLGNSAWDFWAVSFGPGIVLGFVGSPKNFFGVLSFVPIWSSLSLIIWSTPMGLNVCACSG